MHAVFALYGKLEEVELAMRDMRSQKHYLRMYKDDGSEQKILLQGQMRVGIGGIYEYVFPKEDLDAVLATLRFNEPSKYSAKIPKMYLKILKKMLGIEDIPKFDTTKKYPWIVENVGIIPLGIRYDGEIIEPEGMKYAGWKHEAI